MTQEAESWHRARLSIALLALDPVGLGGAVVRMRASPMRDAVLTELQAIPLPLKKNATQHLGRATVWQHRFERHVVNISNYCFKGIFLQFHSNSSDHGGTLPDRPCCETVAGTRHHRQTLPDRAG